MTDPIHIRARSAPSRRRRLAHDGGPHEPSGGEAWRSGVAGARAGDGPVGLELARDVYGGGQAEDLRGLRTGGIGEELR